MSIHKNPLLLLSYTVPVIAVLIASLVLGPHGVISSDARLYISTGDSFWDGRGLTDTDGSMFNAHGPVAPLLFSAIYYLLGAGVLKTATVFALLCAMFLAVYTAARLGGTRAALFTSFSMLLPGFFWTEMDKVSIDNIQALLVIAITVLLFQPKQKNFLFAGALFGLMLLTKETAGLMLFVPLLWLGWIKPKEFFQKYGLFLLAAFLVSFWWWVVVYINEGIIFPLQQVDEAAGSYNTSPWSLLIFLLCLPLWALFAKKFWNNPQGRLLSATAAAVFPPTFLSFLHGMDERQFIIFSLLAAIMFGTYIASKIQEKNLLVAANCMALAFLFLPLQAKNENNYYIPDPETKEGALVLEQASKSWKEKTIFATLPNGVMSDVRNMVYNTDTPVFPKPLDVDACVASWKNSDIEKLRRRLLFSQEKIWMITRMPSLIKAADRLPGLNILWVSKESKVAFIRINKDLVPGKEYFRDKFKGPWMQERPCRFLENENASFIDYFRDDKEEILSSDKILSEVSKSEAKSSR